MPTITPKQISQAKLTRYLELKACADELTALRAELIELAVEKKLPCQPGRYALALSARAGQRRPEWRTELVKLASEIGKDGEKVAQEITDATKPGKAGYEIAVVDRENPLG